MTAPRSAPVAALLRSLLAALLVSAIGCADPFLESATVLTSTPDSIGPYRVYAVAVGMSGKERIELRYRAGEVSSVLIMTDIEDSGIGSGEVHWAAIPGQPVGTEIEYRIAIVGDDEDLDTDPVASRAGYRFSIVEANPNGRFFRPVEPTADAVERHKDHAAVRP